MPMFSWYDNRPGPGVRPDAPRKTGLARWWEILTRDFGAFWLGGTLALLALVPWLLGLYFAIAAHTLLVLLAVCVAGGALAGPFWAAFADLLFRGLRDEPFLWRHAWGHALRRNARESVLPGVLCCMLYGFQFFTLYHLEPGGSALNFLILLMAGLLVLTMLALWMWPQVALFTHPLPLLLKNSVLLAFSFPGRTLAAAVLCLLYLGAAVLLAPLSFLALPVTGVWLPLSAAWCILYRPLEKTFDLEASIRALRERE